MQGEQPKLNLHNPVVMKGKLANKITVASFLRNRQFSLQNSPEANPKKSFIKPINWRLGRKGKYIVTLGIIAVFLISCFAFLSWENSLKANIATEPQDGNSTSPSPTPHPKGPSLPNIAGIINGISHAAARIAAPPKAPGVVESSHGMNDTVWREVAANAWAFFKPGVGVDATTGLPYAGGAGFKAFTDWDLGAYIQAVIDAQEIGLINATGTWGANDRLNMVLTFLENRPLNATTGWPFWFYDATNEQGYLENTTYASNSVDIVDAGKLLVALSNIKAYNSSLSQRVDNIVLHGRSSYAQLLPSIENMATSNNPYAYYTASGFASFWPKQLGNIPSQIVTNVFNTQNITTYGVTLPDAPMTCEPLLLSIFELSNTDTRLTSLMAQVFQAQQAYYFINGTYAAWSEGSSPFNGYIYEWVVAPNGDTWQITDATQYYFQGAIPVIFTKAAFGFLALYNSTFTRNMVIYLEKALPTPTNGYFDGVDAAQDLDAGNPGCETNSLILDAALYYILNNPGN